jgi:hypothetical protein
MDTYSFTHCAGVLTRLRLSCSLIQGAPLSYNAMLISIALQRTDSPFRLLLTQSARSPVACHVYQTHES